MSGSDSDGGSVASSASGSGGASAQGVQDGPIVPDAWARALASLVKVARARQGAKAKAKAKTKPASSLAALTVAVCGAKGLGKSTFLRMLAGRLVDESEAVFYLDTDLGQPEFGLPGQVSLTRLGPGASPCKSTSLFVGDLSPREHPTQYLRAVLELVLRYRKGELGEIGEAAVSSRSVLLVNTHGWNISMGADMVRAILDAAQVSHVVHMKHASRPDAIAVDGTSVQRVYKLAPATMSTASESPKEARFQRCARYFGAACLTELELKAPVRISTASAPARCLTAEESVAKQYVLEHGLVGCMVGLCDAREDGKDAPWMDLVGMAVVVGQDAERQELLVVTPVRDLSCVRAVVLGSQPVPLMRWYEGNCDAVAFMHKRNFFAFRHQVVNAAAPAAANRKNLKRRRLAFR